MLTTTLITEEDIAMLVDRFYTKVREDAEIGPIFNATVESWDGHLSLLKDFWSTVLLGTGRYKGNPMLAHFPLSLEEKHFQRWLQLFAETAKNTLSPEHAQIVGRKAQQIAANMRNVLSSFQNPPSLRQ